MTWDAYILKVIMKTNIMNKNECIKMQTLAIDLEPYFKKL